VAGWIAQRPRYTETLVKMALEPPAVPAPRPWDAFAQGGCCSSPPAAAQQIRPVVAALGTPSLRGYDA